MQSNLLHLFVLIRGVQLRFRICRFSIALLMASSQATLFSLRLLKCVEFVYTKKMFPFSFFHLHWIFFLLFSRMLMNIIIPADSILKETIWLLTWKLPLIKITIIFHFLSISNKNISLYEIQIKHHH